MRKAALLFSIPFLLFCAARLRSFPQNSVSSGDLDSQVRRFLESRRGTWRDMNVPVQDGQTLHDIIIEHEYKSALEIGTSTGHSGIWIAWALARTGGRLITIEIDKDRHDEAVKNFQDAGLAKYILFSAMPTKTGTRTIWRPFCPN
jgi:caffeoyl-CoA O-methyltransferase